MTSAARNRSAGTIAVLGGLAAIGPLSGDTYLPALPQIGEYFAAPAVQVQLTLTASLFGLALGQLLVGPMSDAWGRRRPLLVGLALYTVVSLACALAPALPVLVGLRFLQGLSGAAGIVLGRAMVRDLYSGTAAVRAFSQIMLVFGVAPIVAPLLGSAILGIADWRGIFVLLALLGGLLFAVVGVRLGETLPPSRRTSGGTRELARVMGRLLVDRRYVGYALSCALAFAGMFAYIAGSPFVVQMRYGASPLVFAVIFAVNAAGIAGVGQVNARLVATVPPRRLLSVGLGAQALGAAMLLLVVTLGARLGLVALAPAMFVVVASVGLVLPNATALALERFPDSAGAASSLMGGLHFAVGASVVPLVSLGGADSDLAFGLVIVGTSLAAVLALTILAPLGRIRREIGAEVAD